MLLNAAAVRGLVPNVPPLSPRFMGPPPPVSVKRKALFSPTGSRDIPHPVKFENLVPSICLYILRVAPPRRCMTNFNNSLTY